MKYVPLILLLTASPALSQSPELEKACISVAQKFLLVPAIATGVVQSFPELDPPGARLTFSTRDDAKASDFTNEIECEFKNATAPFALFRFCISGTCYSEKEEDLENRRRFLEVQALMARES